MPSQRIQELSHCAGHTGVFSGHHGIFSVEVQLRTMAMDFWASMEHRVCYKKQPRNRERLEQDFCRYARILEEIEEFETHNERRGSDGG